MKKFEFRLQKVLDVKEMILRKTQKDLAFAENRKLEAEQELVKIEDFVRAYLQKNSSQLAASASDLKIQHDYYNQILDDVKAQKERISQCILKVKEIRNRLLDQQKDREALALLKEKYFEEYTHEMLREEQISMDEIAILGSNALVS